MSFKKVLIVSIVIVASVLAIATATLLAIRQRPTDYRQSRLIIKSTELLVEIAETPAQQTLGLSGRVTLAKDSGMLFLFRNSDTRSFWMKDMYFPIDILWLNAQWQIVGVDKNVVPESYPATYGSPGPIKAVIEVNAGWVEENKIFIGDMVRETSE